MYSLLHCCHKISPIHGGRRSVVRANRGPSTTTLRGGTYITQYRAPSKIKQVTPKASLDWQTLNYESYLIGKAIIVFTMVYYGLNWAHYRRMRRDLDDEEHEKD